MKIESPTPFSFQWIALAAVASAGLFMLAMSMALSSQLLIYTPALPLFMVGLSSGYRPAVAAALGAMVVVLLAGQVSGLKVFMILIVLPSMLFLRQLWRVDDAAAVIPNTGRAMTKLAAYAAGIVGLIIYEVATHGSGMTGFLPKAHENEPEIMVAIRQVMQDYPYVIIAVSAWVHMVLMYGVAVLANAILDMRQRAIFPSLRLWPFLPPGWYIILLLASGVMSLVGGGASMDAAKGVFMTILFPYFLVGIAHLHQWARQKEMPVLWLSMAYFFTLMFSPFSLLGFLGVGLYKHGLALSNRLNQ